MADRPAPVPMCDVLAQYNGLKPELDAAVVRVLASGMAINGPDVAAFEKEAAAYLGVAHAVGCADGTEALSLALAALDVGPGDEVVIPPFTFFATVGSVVRCGATPVFADIDPETFNLSPAAFEKAITPRTKAVIPVHLFGQSADMGPINEIAARRKIHVIEDAAQAFGAEYAGRKCGGIGEIGCFSFYPSKNLGTLGDAGMVTTNDADLAKKLLALRNHGSEVKYFHKYVGWNARLDTIHAAMLRVKLRHVAGWVAGRERAAARYDEMFRDAGLDATLCRPARRSDRRHTFNQYTVRVPGGRRDAIVKHLKDSGVGCDIYYPLPLHLQECLKHLDHRPGDFPASETAAAEVLSLPMFPEITEGQQRRVVDSLAAFAVPIRRAA